MIRSPISTARVSVEAEAATAAWQQQNHRLKEVLLVQDAFLFLLVRPIPASHGE